MSVIAMERGQDGGLQIVVDGKPFNGYPDVIDTDQTYTDRYQRAPSERWLKKHSGDAFNPLLLGAIIVSERERRGRKFSIVDGQHRVELCSREGVDLILAVVLTGLTLQEEAKLFSALQRERRTTTPYENFQSDIVADDPAAKAIVRILKSAGLELSPTTDSPGSIKCVRALENIYAEDPARLRVVVELLQFTWGDIPGARSERMVRGLWAFVRQEGEDLDMDRFVDRLQTVTPSHLATKAQQLRDGEDSTGSLPQYMTKAISNAYRKRK